MADDKRGEASSEEKYRQERERIGRVKRSGVP
jgi:hypothetical protein